MKYKGILFDLDGVICDTAGLHYLAWKRLANELGGDINEEFNETLKGVDRAESLKRILAHLNIDVASARFEQLMTQKNDWYVESLNTLSSNDVLPGILDFLLELKQREIKIAIASASKNAPNILEKIGVIDYVDTIANPADVANNKPAPDIFLLAAKQLGLETYEVLGIEDAQAGIDALNAANIDSLAIGDNLNGSTYKVSKTKQVTIEYIYE